MLTSLCVVDFIDVNSETMKANKYVDIFGVGSKVVYCQSPFTVVPERVGNEEQMIFISFVCWFF